MTQLTRYDVKGRVTVGGPRLTFICRGTSHGLTITSSEGDHTVTIHFGDDPQTLTGEYAMGATAPVLLVGHRHDEDDYHFVRMDAEEGFEHLWIEVSWSTSVQLDVALGVVV